MREEELDQSENAKNKKSCWRSKNWNKFWSWSGAFGESVGNTINYFLQVCLYLNSIPNPIFETTPLPVIGYSKPTVIVAAIYGLYAGPSVAIINLIQNLVNLTKPELLNIGKKVSPDELIEILRNKLQSDPKSRYLVFNTIWGEEKLEHLIVNIASPTQKEQASSTSEEEEGGLKMRAQFSRAETAPLVPRPKKKKSTCCVSKAKISKKCCAPELKAYQLFLSVGACLAYPLDASTTIYLVVISLRALTNAASPIDDLWLTLGALAWGGFFSTANNQSSCELWKMINQDIHIEKQIKSEDISELTSINTGP